MKIKFRQDVTLIAFFNEANSVFPKSFKKGDELECVSFFCNNSYFKESLITVASDISGSHWAAWVFNSVLFSPDEFYPQILRN